MTTEKSKLTLKSLLVKINGLQEELKDIKDELKDVKEELETFRQKGKEILKEVKDKCKEKEESFVEILKCKQCDNSFNSKKKLKKHIVETHVQKSKCKTCEEMFDKNCELEVHIKENHTEIEHFDCDQCDLKFILKWRLKKHQEMHTQSITAKCHYFNNKKKCPFEALGCMFEHTYSSMCKFGESCNRELCSFQHDQSKSSLNDDKDSNEEDVKIKCDYCLFRSQNKSELKMHTEKRHNLNCKKCDYKTTSGLDLNEHLISKRHG